jgi:PAS domain S-box-containing protein
MAQAPDVNRHAPAEAYEAMVRHLTDVIIVLDGAEGTIRYASPSLETVFGHHPGELLGTDPFALVHPDDLAKERRRYEMVGRHHGSPPAEPFRFADADGNWRTVETVASSLGDDGGIVIVLRDVTRRVQTERQLATSEDRFRTLADLAPVAIFEMDPEGRIVWANERQLALSDASSPEELSELWPERIHPDDRGRVLAAWRDVLAEPRRHEIHSTMVTPDGRERRMLSRVEPVHDGDGQLAGWVGTAEDVTALADAVTAAEAQTAALGVANQQLRASQAEAAQATRAKDEFLSRMSHELRTPLNSIIGFAQLLEGGHLSPDEQREAVALVLRSGRHLLGLVDEVLDLSRIGSGELALTLEPVDVAHLAADAVHAVRPEANAAQVQILLEGEPGPLYARADRRRLLQVLLDLATNGIRYNHTGGWVAVRHSQGPDGVQLTVRDSGRGIPEEHLTRLFEPFDRLDAEATGVTGTGLGLTLADADADERTVLYIEDNPVNYKLVERTLQSRPGIRLVGAECGLDGLAAAGAEHPDLILLDLHLPDVSGVEVLEALRADPDTAAIPVTVLTADVQPGLREQLTGDGRTGWLTKPLNLPDLLAVVDGVGPTG